MSFSKSVTRLALLPTTGKALSSGVPLSRGLNFNTVSTSGSDHGHDTAGARSDYTIPVYAGRMDLSGNNGLVVRNRLNRAFPSALSLTILIYFFLPAFPGGRERQGLGGSAWGELARPMGVYKTR